MTADALLPALLRSVGRRRVGALIVLAVLALNPLGLRDAAVDAAVDRAERRAEHVQQVLADAVQRMLADLAAPTPVVPPDQAEDGRPAAPSLAPRRTP
jgi:hypothetical protein